MPPGSNVTFTATGAGLYGVTYQWQFTNMNLSGATNPTLTLTNVQLGQVGAYDVVVTGNGGMGSVVSSNAYMRSNLIKISFAIVLLFSKQSAFSQGFVNLDFESAHIVPITGSPNYPYDIETSYAVPGWTVLIGGNSVSQITYNDPALGSTFVTLWATNGAQISGNYSVLLQGGLTASSASISQTGLVPIAAESLLFEAQQTGAGTLRVSLGGQNLSFIPVFGGPNYTFYGADISAFAGQTEQLIFSALEVSTYANNWNIDNIQFSSSSIPEPSVFGLLALGGLFLGLRRWRKLRMACIRWRTAAGGSLKLSNHLMDSGTELVKALSSSGIPTMLLAELTILIRPLELFPINGSVHTIDSFRFIAL